jgi:hypothetical protein
MTHFSAAKRREDVDEVAASEGSMTVSGVQVAGVALGCFGGEVSGCHSTPSVFDIWAMPEDGPPIGLQRFAVIVEVATPVSFTVETTVLPSFARRRRLKVQPRRIRGRC